MNYSATLTGPHSTDEPYEYFHGAADSFGDVVTTAKARWVSGLLARRICSDDILRIEWEDGIRTQIAWGSIYYTATA